MPVLLDSAWAIVTLKSAHANTVRRHTHGFLSGTRRPREDPGCEIAVGRVLRALARRLVESYTSECVGSPAASRILPEGYEIGPTGFEPATS